MNEVPLRALLPAALLLAAQSFSTAQSTWTGNSSAAWNTAGNWSPSGVPGSGASVIVDKNSATVYTLQVNTSPTLTNWTSNITGNTTIVRASGNQTLNIAGVLTKTGTASLTFRSQTIEKLTMTVGALNLTDNIGSTITLGTTGNELGSLNITTANVSSASGTNQLVFLGANNTADYTIGSLNLGAGGVVVIANGVANGEQRAINVGSLNGTGGTVRGGNGVTPTTGMATLNLTGTSDGSYSGALIDGAAVVRVVKSGSATQTLGGSYIYTGGTLISGGTLLTTKAAALSEYNTAGKVEVNGGTLGVQIGTGGWTTAQVDALLGNATKTGGSLGIDTTSGSLTQWTTFTTSNLGNLGLAKLGANTLTLNGTNTYTGATNVTAGTLLINGNQTAASGAVTVASGAILGGNGTVGGATTIAGIASPGNGDIATLNIANNVTWVGASSNGTSTDWIFQLGAGNTSDLINITGNFLKDTTLGTHFRFDFSGSTHTGTFKLAGWSGSSTFSAGDFSFTNLGAGLAGSFSMSATELDFTVFTAIPEPSTWIGMVALALGGGLVVIRRHTGRRGYRHPIQGR